MKVILRTGIHKAFTRLCVDDRFLLRLKSSWDRRWIVARSSVRSSLDRRSERHLDRHQQPSRSKRLKPL